jgi:hypothetical protein
MDLINSVDASNSVDSSNSIDASNNALYLATAGMLAKDGLYK